MKRYLFLITLLTALTGRIIAQSVTVDATIDSLQILIGEQAKIKLQVSLDTDKRAILPAYTDTLVRGVEIVDIAKPDTQMLNDGTNNTAQAIDIYQSSHAKGAFITGLGPKN